MQRTFSQDTPTITIPPLVFTACVGTNQELSLSVDWAEKQLLDYSIKQRPHHVTYISERLDQLVTSANSALKAELAYTPNTTQHVRQVMLPILTALFDDMLANDPMMLQYVQYCENAIRMAVGGRGRVPYQVGWGCDTPEIETDSKVHPSIKYPLGCYVNIGYTDLVAPEERAIIIGYANVGSTKDAYPESLIVCYTQPANELHDSGLSRIGGFATVPIAHVSWVYESKYRVMGSSAHQSLGDDMGSIISKYNNSYPSGGVAYIESLTAHLTRSTIRVINKDLHPTEESRKLALGLKDTLRTITPIDKRLENFEPNIDGGGLYANYLEHIQSICWVHHTSNQFYKILGFVGGDSLNVLYMNTQNHNIYVRPATDWSRSFTVKGE